MKIESTGHTVSFEGEDFEDICDAAGYGIGYWCINAIVDEDENTYTVWEEEGPRKFVITQQMMEKAYGEILDGKHRIAPYIVEYFRSGDVGDIDAAAGDVLVQICCFGELVYG